MSRILIRAVGGIKVEVQQKRSKTAMTYLEGAMEKMENKERLPLSTARLRRCL
jgi:hypothetical protein